MIYCNSRLKEDTRYDINVVVLASFLMYLLELHC